jgi:long-subunit acyl-CoA synthetase (AMP-forming)
MNAATMMDVLAARPANPTLSDPAQNLSAAQVIKSIHGMAWKLAGCRVLAVLADNSIDWVIADLAALHVGAVHLPIPTFFNAAQMVNAMTQAGVDAALTDQPERIFALGLGFTSVGTHGSLHFLRRLTSATNLPAGTAKISFTSGSTGNPKGVCLSMAGLMATAHSIKTALANLHLAKHLTVLPLTLLLENSAGIYAALLSGAQVHLPSLPMLGWQGMAGFNPAMLQKTTQNTAPQSMILVPELLKVWTLYLNATGQRAPSSLLFVAVGGAHVDPGLLSRARKVGIPAHEGYGLTECGSVVSLNRPGDEGTGVGRILPHVQLRLKSGEVHLKTSAFLGYTGDTASSVSAGQGFATGDLGCLDTQGHLHLMGRSKNLLITTFGRNISPEWVESVLLAQNTIAQAVVMGDAHPWLAAIVAPMPGASPEQVATAVAQANAGLPDYAQIKQWITSVPFTLANGLATGNGRPMRAAIARNFAAQFEALYNIEETRP